MTRHRRLPGAPLVLGALLLAALPLVAYTWPQDHPILDPADARQPSPWRWMLLPVDLTPEYFPSPSDFEPIYVT